MDVEGPESWEIQQLLRQELAVSGNDHQVWLDLSELMDELGGPGFFGLSDGELMPLRFDLDSGWSGLKLAAFGAIGLCDDLDDLELPDSQKPHQAGAGERGRSKKHDLHETDSSCGSNSIRESRSFEGGSRSSHRRFLRVGDFSFAQGGRASGAKIGIEFAVRQDQEKFFPDRLGFPAFRTVQFTGFEGSELLRHSGSTEFCKDMKHIQEDLYGRF